MIFLLLVAFFCRHLLRRHHHHRSKYETNSFSQWNLDDDKINCVFLEYILVQRIDIESIFCDIPKKKIINIRKANLHFIFNIKHVWKKFTILIWVLMPWRLLIVGYFFSALSLCPDIIFLLLWLQNWAMSAVVRHSFRFFIAVKSGRINYESFFLLRFNEGIHLNNIGHSIL